MEIGDKVKVVALAETELTAPVHDIAHERVGQVGEVKWVRPKSNVFYDYPVRVVFPTEDSEGINYLCFKESELAVLPKAGSRVLIGEDTLPSFAAGKEATVERVEYCAYHSRHDFKLKVSFEDPEGLIDMCYDDHEFEVLAP
jgi:hypothetical protein